MSFNKWWQTGYIPVWPSQVVSWRGSLSELRALYTQTDLSLTECSTHQRWPGVKVFNISFRGNMCVIIQTASSNSHLWLGVCQNHRHTSVQHVYYFANATITAVKNQDISIILTLVSNIKIMSWINLMSNTFEAILFILMFNNTMRFTNQ